MEFKDKYGRNAELLASKKLFLLDMDGTIYEGMRLFDETLPFLAAIKNNGARYIFITNNSSKSVDDYVKKLGKMGIGAVKEEFFTSSQATALYIKKNYPGKTVFVMGTRSLIAELNSYGINTTEEVTDKAGVILIGYDTELTYQKLINISYMLEKYDLPYIATNPDRACPCEFGFVPDCYGMAEMLFLATGKRPVYIGKPETAMIDFVMDKFNCSKNDTVVVGDRLYTDIAAGLNANVTAVCVLSGEAKIEDIENGEIKPDIVLDSVGDITRIIEKK